MSWTNGVINTPLLRAPGLPLVTRTTKPRTVRVAKDGPTTHTSWPLTSDQLCWHCCHAFTGTPLPMPIQYDERRNFYKVCGTFCSWACMKSYNQKSNSHTSSVRGMHIAHFHRTCTGKVKLIHPAPPREALKAFGGWMTLQQFRQCDTTYTIIPDNVLMTPPIVEEVPVHRRARPSAKSLQESVSFKDATAQNEMMRLRRPKPLTGHNLLVKSLGVQILDKAIVIG